MPRSGKKGGKKTAEGGKEKKKIKITNTAWGTAAWRRWG